MKIKKIGHCCLVIDILGKRIMTDPGAYSVGQTEEKDICAVLITHEHQDHLHIESLKSVLTANPEAIVVTNDSVGAILRKEGIPYKKVEDNQTEMVNGILIEGFGSVHALIYESIPPVVNTGYFVNNSFFYPGDAFYNPGKHVDVLALPVAGPWMKISEAIDYLKLIKPKACIPVHDGMLIASRRGPIERLAGEACESLKAAYLPLAEGGEAEILLSDGP